MPKQDTGWLKLKGNAAKAANELNDQCAKIVFTSGRRDIADQARAMAQNIAKDKTYLAKTYKPSKAKSLCLEWLEQNPGKSRNDIQKALLDILEGLSDTEVQKISRHLGGLAFDVQPGSADLKVVKDTVRKFKGEFLDHEGKLCRWHAQFTN